MIAKKALQGKRQLFTDSCKVFEIGRFTNRSKIKLRKQTVLQMSIKT